MTEIQYVDGDATLPVGEGPKIVVNVCNDAGAWGKGFVVAVGARWPLAERRYRWWAKNGLPLGNVQFVEVEPAVWVANAVAQAGTRPRGDKPPIRYDALASCLTAVADRALEEGASVHMPYIGCGLAGGNWAAVEPLVSSLVCARDVRVTVYRYAASSPGDRAYVEPKLGPEAESAAASRVSELRR